MNKTADRHEVASLPVSGMRLADLMFELPDEQIALYPPAHRSDSRLLVVDAAQQISDNEFSNIAAFFGPEDVLVLNRTKVSPARTFATDDKNRKVEVLWLREDQENLWQAFGTTRRLTPGSTLSFEGWQAEVLSLDREYMTLQTDRPIATLLQQQAQLAIPPYITKRRKQAIWAEDTQRYQTVFADAPGAIAAPTASLHWTNELLEQVAARGTQVLYLTLHVGPGTFKPVRVDNLQEHKVDAEWVAIDSTTMSALDSAKKKGKRITACGTTVIRALEGVHRKQGFQGSFKGWIDETIIPPYNFAVADRIITNFHVPGSSLLALIAAFAGAGQWQAIYQHAVDVGYRFYSYGDASLLWKNNV